MKDNRSVKIECYAKMKDEGFEINIDMNIREVSDKEVVEVMGCLVHDTFKDLHCPVEYLLSQLVGVVCMQMAEENE